MTLSPTSIPDEFPTLLHNLRTTKAAVDLFLARLGLLPQRDRSGWRTCLLGNSRHGR